MIDNDKDSVPKMAAAAAVSVYLKKRKERIYALSQKGYQINPWALAARSEGIHNSPMRNSWNLRKA